MEDNRIAKAVRYIHKHIAEEIELENSRKFLVFPKTTLSGFSKRNGHHSVTICQSKKIEKAQLLLLTEELAVKEIAFQLAFEDYSYFNRLFKK